MQNYHIAKIKEHPELIRQASWWFHSKWGIPQEAHFESMQESIPSKKAVPQWYVVLDKKDIIGGIGVIENDFHNRKDLSPNVCAVYAEERYRKQGIARCYKKITPRQMARLRDLNQRCSDSKDMFQHWENVTAFHLQLMICSQNQYAYLELQRAMAVLRRAYAQFYWDRWDTTSPPMDTKNHQKILDYLEAAALLAMARCTMVTSSVSPLRAETTGR